ncbi:Uncharacterized protein APZ42_030545 [Daphnia magna]|uniref:Uncharacterized protein n=1 Tax=Daphnia magna TaxID=35525 RepID=A0A164NK90_9CRUS|nr:Uncharacterized protein APZ42_030545 [Daphnia magna]
MHSVEVVGGGGAKLKGGRRGGQCREIRAAVKRGTRTSSPVAANWIFICFCFLPCQNGCQGKGK